MYPPPLPLSPSGGPGALERWLAFLSVYGLTTRELLNFLTHASRDLLETCTLWQAGQVVQYLKMLGVKDQVGKAPGGWGPPHVTCWG